MNIQQDEVSASKNAFGDAHELEKIRSLAHTLDKKFTLPGGINVGVDGLVGLIPGVGDAASGALSLWLFLKARRLGLSTWTQARMLANIALDTVLGSVPFVGDIFDLVYKANMRNLRLVEKGLEKRLRGGDSRRSRVV